MRSRRRNLLNEPLSSTCISWKVVSLSCRSVSPYRHTVVTRLLQVKRPTLLTGQELLDLNVLAQKNRPYVNEKSKSSEIPGLQ
jgi:hypothetical protein